MHEDKHHSADHSTHDLLMTGHKAVEEIIQQKVIAILEEKHGEQLDKIANHIAEGVGAHLKEMTV